MVQDHCYLCTGAPLLSPHPAPPPQVLRRPPQVPTKPALLVTVPMQVAPSHAEPSPSPSACVSAPHQTARAAWELFPGDGGSPTPGAARSRSRGGVINTSRMIPSLLREGKHDP